MSNPFQDDKERERFLNNNQSTSDTWSSPASKTNPDDAPSPESASSSRKRKAVRLGLIFFVVVLLIGAFATDPKPVYNKATELLAADEWPAMNELPPDSDSTIVVEGGSWATELHAAVEPSCDRNTTKQLYPKPIARTALATFPRSGNTFIRTMVERATGYLSSSTYCDRSLAKTFKAECNKDTDFFVKTHYPALKGRGRNFDKDHGGLRFDRAVTIVRNPLDTLFSYWQFNKAYEAAKDKTSEKIHMARINVTLGETDEQVAEVKLFATRWLEFNELWHNVAMPVQLLRYEDLRTEPLSLLMKLVQFILPEEEQPSLQRLSCALELDEAHQAYQSKKRAIFSSWDDWEPSMRKWVVHKTKNVWCRNGYDKLLLQELGQKASDELGMDCSQVRLDVAAKFDTSGYYE